MKTSEEKAKEIINQHFNLIWSGSGDVTMSGMLGKILRAKQSALFTTSEIIDAIPKNIQLPSFGSALFDNPDIKFWEDVYQKIENYDPNNLHGMHPEPDAEERHSQGS